MADDPIHQPHDKLFKAGFGDPVNAAGLLRWQLPAAISGKIDWDHLRLEPGSFVDSHYRHHESDLLFSAPLAGVDCLIHVLFESFCRCAASFVRGPSSFCRCASSVVLGPSSFVSAWDELRTSQALGLERHRKACARRAIAHPQSTKDDGQRTTDNGRVLWLALSGFQLN